MIPESKIRDKKPTWTHVNRYNFSAFSPSSAKQSLVNGESVTTEHSLKAVTQFNLWTEVDFEDNTNHWDKMADTNKWNITIGPGYKKSPLAVMRAAHRQSW